MEAAVVSVSEGAIGSLLGKLGDLLAGNYNLLKEAVDDIMFLKSELESMRAFLERMSEAEEEPDKQAKCWANEVRDLSYDIEDSVDEFMRPVECDSNSKPSEFFKGLIHRAMNLLTMMDSQRKTAKEFRGLKRRVMEASERRTRYKVDDAVFKPNNTSIDIRLLAVYEDTAGLVGIDRPRDELVKLMVDEESVSTQQMKVLSIVGFGGLGKTTLANQIYRKLNGQFKCQAFVSVSQKPNIRNIFRRMLAQVGYVGPEGTNVDIWAEDELISALRESLMDKRYIIVIDDVWDETAWNVIRCALPRNCNGSMVITTTRIETVARACCCNQRDYVYKMKSLSHEDSRKLFFTRVFGSEGACPLYLEEVSAQILKRCGGMPLAIVTISSLLASEQTKLKEHWEHILVSLAPNFEVKPTLEGMRHILSLSYINLPHYLKTCMLYLCIYPEDYIIKKNDLVRQWVAQGFVSKAHGQDQENVAEGYFNELINRSIIRPVDTDYNNEVLSCRLHDMMLDLIIHKCREENFITATDDIQAMIGLPNKVRRLSLNLDGIIDNTVLETTRLSQVRALSRFGTSAYAPPLSKFKHLRVLALEFSIGNHQEIIDLSGISHLFQLRYLNIKADCNILLPSNIQGLEQLETLELRAYGLEFPSDVIHLCRLLHLIIPSGTNLPGGIGNMKSLCTLHVFDVVLNSIENIRHLGDLTNLRDLRICYAKLESLDDMERRQRLDVLRCSLEKLCNLRYLLTDSEISSRYFFQKRGTAQPQLSYVLNPPSASPCFLRRLQRLWVFSRVPKWIGELHNLFDLDLAVEVLENDIRLFAQLQSLNHLRLHIEGTPEAEDKLVIYRTGFPVLKYFRLSTKTSQLIFEAGAMPSLQEVEIRLDSQYGAKPMGIEHLLSLKKIKLELRGHLDDGFSWRKYRQKEILGAKHPKSYFRCTYLNSQSQGCKVLREVQRTEDDPELFHIMYDGKHLCNHGSAATNRTGSERPGGRARVTDVGFPAWAMGPLWPCPVSTPTCSENNKSSKVINQETGH